MTADGVLHEVDTIVLGTGFAATELLAPMEVTGRGGRRLRDAWSGGAEAYLGTTVSGFPNLFLLYGPNTNLGHNSIVLMLESQIRYVAQAVAHLRDGRRALDRRAGRRAGAVQRLAAAAARRARSSPAAAAAGTSPPTAATPRTGPARRSTSAAAPAGCGWPTTYCSPRGRPPQPDGGPAA